MRPKLSDSGREGWDWLEPLASPTSKSRFCRGLRYDRGHRNSTSLPAHSPMKKPLGDRQNSLPHGLMLCVFLSGTAELIYQVARSNALGLVFGHAVYAIATVLAAFMAGLAVGSAYLGRWSGRRPQPGLVRLYAQIELPCGASGGLSLAALFAVRALFNCPMHFCLCSSTKPSTPSIQSRSREIGVEKNGAVFSSPFTWSYSRPPGMRPAHQLDDCCRMTLAHSEATS